MSKASVFFYAYFCTSGLQVYKDGVNPGVVDIEEFAEIPPSKCKKGGATFRTGCGDDGYPIRDKKKVFCACKSMITKLLKRPIW